MTRLVLTGSALIFLAFGLGFLVMPTRLLGTLGPLATTPTFFVMEATGAVLAVLALRRRPAPPR